MTGRSETSFRRRASSGFQVVVGVAAPAPPTWTTPRETLRVVAHRPYLKRSVVIALIVGTVLFSINQLDVVLKGDATAGVWAKSLITYVVPFVVSNVGILMASHERREA